MSIVQRIHIPVQTRAIDTKNLTVDIVASTPAVDSYGTIIDQSGWDLDQFKRNPVITWAHDDRGYTASEGLPVANAIPETVRVEAGQLKMKLRFTPEDVHPFGFRVFRMISEGFLHGVSVGFDPQEDVTSEDDQGVAVRKYTRCKLLETAVVTIPSNDDALVQRARLLNREKDSEFVERMRILAREIDEMAKKPETKDAEPKEATPEVKPDEVKPLEEPKKEEKAAEIEQVLIDGVPVGVPKEHMEKWKEILATMEKHRSYFDNKQPANKAATSALAKFYKKILKEDPPAEEVKAWERMAETIEAMEEKPEEIPETPKEDAEHETNDEVVAEVTAEVSTEPAQPAEAPQDARKAFVQIPINEIPDLFRRIKETCVDAAVKASQEGIPKSEWNAVIDATGDQIAKGISHFSP